MTISYRDRVQVMCDALEIANPIREEDLIVKAISFRIKRDRVWVKVPGTDMNRAGRLFFQYCYICSLKPIFGDQRKTMSGVTADGLHQVGKYYFGDMWDDAEEKGRTLIIAFKAADYVRLHFK